MEEETGVILWWPVIPLMGALVFYGLFVVFYAARSAWWTHPIGWVLLLSNVALVLLLTHLAVVLFVGDYPGRVNVWGLLAVLLCLGGAAKFFALLRVQRSQRDGEHPRRRSTDL